MRDTAISVGKLLLKTVIEVSDPFPPLKVVATGLQLIVEHVEVRFQFCGKECIMTTSGIAGGGQPS
jgi:hypothetical protein